MHAVNNGPVYKFAADQRVTNIDAFKDAGIPYVRTHDAAFYAAYGGVPEAAPCAMNGLFNTDFVCDKLKGYYPFFMFNVLYQLGTAVDARSESGNVYVSAAKNENSGAVMVTYYDDDDDAPDAVVSLICPDLRERGSWNITS